MPPILASFRFPTLPYLNVIMCCVCVSVGGGAYSSLIGLITDSDWFNWETGILLWLLQYNIDFRYSSKCLYFAENYSPSTALYCSVSIAPVFLLISYIINI